MLPPQEGICVSCSLPAVCPDSFFTSFSAFPLRHPVQAFPGHPIEHFCSVPWYCIFHFHAFFLSSSYYIFDFFFVYLFSSRLLLHGEKHLFQFCSLLYPQWLGHCLGHIRHSTKIFWMNEWMNACSPQHPTCKHLCLCLFLSAKSAPPPLFTIALLSLFFYLYLCVHIILYLYLIILMDWRNTELNACVQFTIFSHKSKIFIPFPPFIQCVS